MPQTVSRPTNHADDDPSHPIGTLVIVLIFALLFVLGWAAMFFLVFQPRGTVGV